MSSMSSNSKSFLHILPVLYLTSVVFCSISCPVGRILWYSYGNLRQVLFWTQLINLFIYLFIHSFSLFTIFLVGWVLTWYYFYWYSKFVAVRDLLISWKRRSTEPKQGTELNGYRYSFLTPCILNSSSLCLEGRVVGQRQARGVRGSRAPPSRGSRAPRTSLLCLCLPEKREVI